MYPIAVLSFLASSSIICCHHHVHHHVCTGAPLREQLDLAREAQHLARFNHNFRLWTNLSFPVPIFPLVSPDVLVESFEEGCSISAYVKNPGRHTRPLADLGMNCYLKMLLKDNFVHADMHPGNILVRSMYRWR